jgi:hypothetical protein
MTGGGEHRRGLVESLSEAAPLVDAIRDRAAE